MKNPNLTLILFIMLMQQTYAQDTVMKVGTFKVSKLYMADEIFTDAIINPGRVEITYTGDNIVIPNLTYPVEAKEFNAAGLIQMTHEWDTNGRTFNVKLMESVHPILNEAALNFVRNMRCTGFKNGLKANTPYTVTIRFSLE